MCHPLFCQIIRDQLWVPRALIPPRETLRADCPTGSDIFETARGFLGTRKRSVLIILAAEPGSWKKQHGDGE